MALVLRFDDEHDHRELRVVGDASDAVSRALELDPFAELWPVRAQLRAQHLHRAITLCLETAETKILAQRIIGDERVKGSPLPNDLLASGGENLGKRSGFFIVERHAVMALSKPDIRKPN